MVLPERERILGAKINLASVPILVFDIETVPDVAGIRRLRGVDPAVSDADVAAMAFQLRRQAVGHDFLPLHLHRVIAISCALRDRDSFRAWIDENVLRKGPEAFAPFAKRAA